MTEYTAENGLITLENLGLSITDRERQVFREKWDEVYRGRRDLINATWTLYSDVLPFICGGSNRISYMVHMSRDSAFAKRLDRTGVMEKLKMVYH